MGPFPSVGLTITWFIWDISLALHISLYSVNILLLVEENTMTTLHNPQIAELIEAGCAFKSDVIISKNETKEIEGKKKK